MDDHTAPALYVEVAVPLPLRNGLSYAVPVGMEKHLFPREQRDYYGAGRSAI